jgi:hypothetical protein
VELRDLLPDHAFESRAFLLKEEEVREYLAAVGDSLPIYQERHVIPPVALVARAVRELITHLSLPPGVTHIAQEVESLAPCPPGVALTLASRVSQNSVRGGWRFLSIAFEVQQEDGSTVVRGNSTVLVPV